MLKKGSLILAALVSVASLGLQAANACSEVLLNKTKGVVVSGRTLDYNCEMGSKICFRAKGTHITDPGLKYTKLTCTPYSWTAKYSAVLVDAFDEPAFIDGMNTEGLSVGTLWQADTQPASQVEAGTHGMANVTLIEYILENAKNIQEAKELMSGLSLAIAVYKGKPMALHWIVTERSGNSVVMELKDGRPKFFDQSSEVGVMTNAPAYDLQLANLKASQNAQNSDPAYTLPGDYKSTSRFVKSAFLLSHLPEFRSTEDAIAAATQILHNVESPKGAQGPQGSYSQWLVVRDQDNLRYLIMGVKHPSPKIVDLKNVDFKQLADRRLTVDSSGSGDVTALTELKSAQSPAAISNN